jgi:hypothetical protein
MAEKTYIGEKKFKIFGEELILTNVFSNKEFLESGGFNVDEVDESIALSEALKKCEELENE